VSAILISKSNNLYRQKQRFNRWQNRDRQSVLDGCNFSYSVIMRVMTFLVEVLKSASSIKMRIAEEVFSEMDYFLAAEISAGCRGGGVALSKLAHSNYSVRC
jgi:hypothetical protein